MFGLNRSNFDAVINPFVPDILLSRKPENASRLGLVFDPRLQKEGWGAAAVQNASASLRGATPRASVLECATALWKTLVGLPRKAAFGTFFLTLNFCPRKTACHVRFSRHTFKFKLYGNSRDIRYPGLPNARQRHRQCRRANRPAYTPNQPAHRASQVARQGSLLPPRSLANGRQAPQPS